MNPDDPEASDDPIGRLIKGAGPRPSASEERMARVRHSVHAGWREGLKRDRRRVILVMARIAAALAIAAGVGVWLRERLRVPWAPIGAVVRIEGSLMSSEGRVVAPGGLLAAGTGLTTAPDARAALLLSDGPSVRLDGGTDLRLISARVLELRRGAVYVASTGRSSGHSTATGTVSSEAGRGSAPIEIRTPMGLVRDLGTEFEVRLADGSLRLSVREGAVGLTREGRTYTAPAGTRLRVGSQGAVENEVIASGGADWDWVLTVAPPFDLDGRPLRDYLDWVSRETGWTVSYADPSIAARAATIILHGSTSGLRPDETPAAILPACGLRHRLEGATLIIENGAAAGHAE